MKRSCAYESYGNSRATTIHPTFQMLEKLYLVSGNDVVLREILCTNIAPNQMLEYYASSLSTGFVYGGRRLPLC